MALTTLQIIEARNAALYALTAQRDLLILDAQDQLDEDVYGDKYDRAVALLAMHNYAKDMQASSGGSLTAESEGQLSRSYGAVSGGDDWLSTKWGKELYELTKECLGGTYTNRMM